MIDQGFCFDAGEWNFPDAPLRGLYARNPHINDSDRRRRQPQLRRQTGTEHFIDQDARVLRIILKLDYASDLELERLYAEQVAPLRAPRPVGAAGSRPTLRNYCAQVWRQAGLWDRIQKSVGVAEFTFAGDPMRIDYCYQRNGTRGFVNTLSVSRSPRDCKEYAYTARRIAERTQSEFTAVTDIELKQGKRAATICAGDPGRSCARSCSEVRLRRADASP